MTWFSAINLLGDDDDDIVVCHDRMNYYWCGLSPRGYHVVNIVLHSAVTVLFMLAYRLHVTTSPDSTTQSLVAGAIFAVHPVHVEAV